MSIYSSSEIKDCLTLDKTLKELIVRKSDLLKQNAKGGVNQNLLNETLKLFYETEDKFAKIKCAKKIEYLRLNETAVLDLEQAIKSEAKEVEEIDKSEAKEEVYVFDASTICY